MFPAASPEAPTAPRARNTDSDRIATIAVVLAYCVLQIVMAVIHDPWIDEAQAWLWATTITNPVDFFIIPGEGHPPLWYWVLKVLSMVLDFNQARYVTLPIAILNAFLLARLLKGQFLLPTLMLFSFVVLQYWGYHFRPYGIVFLAMISAMLLDRNGRPVAATWCLAVACGFHFFAGFLFAFWLVWQWKKGTRLTLLIAPAVLAAAFGVLAILSGMGNVTAGVHTRSFIDGTLANLAWVAMFSEARHPIVAIATLGLITFGLRKEPILLGTLLVLLIGFAAASYSVYGRYPWHFAFMTMLCFMALVLAGAKASRWVMLILLAPQAAVGISAVAERLARPVWGEQDLYKTVAADAGPSFNPEKQLVAWPDISGLTTAAVNNVQLISGNDGAILGPVDWRSWEFESIDPNLLVMPRPYWVICANCEPLIDYLDKGGLKPTKIGDKVNLDNGPLSAYRID